MTCIAALIDKNTVWMGADSAGVGGLHMSVRDDSKVFANGEYIMGFTSSFRMGQLLRWSFVPPARHEDMKDEEFMCTLFVDAVRRCLKTGGYARVSEGAESGGSFLVGYRGSLWLVSSDYQIGISRAGYDAVGCGYEIALGSLYATSEWSDPKSRILVALRAAEQWSAGVRGPFRVIKSGNTEPEVVT